jgi:hypothetical protein
MTYVTIDFSLNSPGICIFKDKYHFISYLKPKSGTKKEQRIQEDIALLSDVVLKEQPDFTNVGAYSSVELGKINRYITSANDIIDIIKEFTKGETQFVFAFEGTSFGSKQGTNNIIDMAAGAAILKLKILEEFNPITIETVAPSTIKKHAGKGNMNKSQLWKVFIEGGTGTDEIVRASDFLLFCVNEIGETLKIPKPFDDLVDAYFLNSYVQTLDHI